MKMKNLFYNFKKSLNAFRNQVRYKNPEHHWAVKLKKKYPKDKALEYFDDFYKSIYKDNWINLRTALLSNQHKYMAVINNYSGADDVKIKLQNIGALDLKVMYDIGKENINNKKLIENNHDKLKLTNNNSIKKIVEETETEESRSNYPNGFDTSVSMKINGGSKQNINRLKKYEDDDCLYDANDDNKMKPVQMKSIEQNNEETIAYDRIINSSSGISASKLFEFIPPSKIKGFEDWIFESDQYNILKEGANFDINVINENKFRFPEHLSLYAFEHHSKSKFPNPNKGSTDVSEYYLFDGSSILPVLALDLQAGDIVLDMCAAPGGKSLAILQTLMPKILVANDVSYLRVKRIKQVFNEYLSNIGEWKKQVFVTQSDARFIADKDLYNKILVDVPCTTDRHSLHEDENNYFNPERIRERLRLPELQTEILVNALKLVAPGGTVVYSTCSLNPNQNESVVKLALKKVWEQTESEMLVKDMSEAIEPLKYFFKFQHCSYGHLVLPTMENNWGPMYFCKIQRIR